MMRRDVLSSMVVFLLFVSLSWGQTTLYHWGDGSQLPQDDSIKYSSFTTSDGLVSISQGSGQEFWYHDSTHGAVFYGGNAFDIEVSGDATITFITCKYSPDGSVFDLTDSEGTPLGSVAAENNGGDDGVAYSFEYTGSAGVITATLNGSYIYLHAINVENAPPAAIPGQTYIYNWADGSELPQDTTIKYSSFTTSDGLVSITKGSGQEFWYHDTSHGAVFYSGNAFDIIVAGHATISFITCTYSPDNVVFDLTDSQGNPLGSVPAENNGGDDGYAYNFSYAGQAGVVTATLNGGYVYLHGINVENAAAVDPSNGKIDVWDFGGEQLDDSLYNNHLDVDTINAWYASSITVGSSGNVLPSFTAGALSWVGAHNDRLRTTDTSITRYDENISGVSGYTGRIYVNSAAATGRYLSLTLSEDDEITLIALSQNGSGRFNFEYVPDPAAQTDVVNVGADLVEVNFVAKQAGTYHIYDDKDKPSYYRVYRQDATYAEITGSVDETAASTIPAGYGIVFTNAAGKSWTSEVSGGAYSAQLPVGYTYDLSLSNANGYIIANGTTLDVTEETTTYDIVVTMIELETVSGSITGLGSDLGDLTGLVYTPDPAAGKIFLPEPVIDTGAGTYSVQLEPNCQYTISALGVNDYEIPANTITVTGDTSADVVFTAKPTYHVTIEAEGLSEDQLAQLSISFTNLYETGYVYDFTSLDGIALRDGTYTIAVSGLDDYPLALALTSNLQVNGADASKSLTFDAVNVWPFNDQVITSSTSSYKGLILTGNVYNEIGKGHLAAKSGGTIQIPVKVGDKVILTYYYSAEFTIDGGETISTSSGSTSLLEQVSYVYPGTEDGFVTITNSNSTTSYFTNMMAFQVVPYSSEITVGVDKDYASINEALDAITRMDRDPNQRVTVMIDPGNYEEMLVVTQTDVTLKNAGTDPNISLLNQGLDIDPNAVRITSYYGHGYDYYSQGSDEKWNADVLRVNLENGYLSHENAGAGTTNGSYWNSTVVVEANGFVAEDIIFENSFNQYVSAKEANDVVVMWDSGCPGERPVDVNNTGVQDRSLKERAAAIAFTGGANQAILNNCRVVGRQDSFYGSDGARVVVYKGAMMGSVDYIFGAMVAVFYQTDLVMNVSDASNDAAYLTAAYQDSGRGYLMYECNVTSTTPGVDTASAYQAKPGYFGRPWKANTSEVVFYNTTIETTDYPGSQGDSLIAPAGWNSSLGGESEFMYEYGTIELSGVSNTASRVSWSTVLSSPVLDDGTDITPFNFTKGDDGWDPIAVLIAAEESEE